MQGCMCTAFTPRASHKLLWCQRCCTSLRVLSLTRGMQVRRGIMPDSDLDWGMQLRFGKLHPGCDHVPACLSVHASFYAFRPVIEWRLAMLLARQLCSGL